MTIKPAEPSAFMAPCPAPGSGTDQTVLLTVTKTGYAAVSSWVMIGFDPSVNMSLSRQ